MDAFLRIVVDEIKTVLEYKEYLKNVDCGSCQNLINEIIDEEYVHVGEALYVLERDERFARMIAKGKAEAAKHYEPMVTLQ